MQEIIEQKGKPCCINMISEEDRKFLANLDRLAAKEARAKARAEAALKAADAVAEAIESEEEVDEVEALLEKQRQEAEAHRAQEEADAKVRAVEEANRAAKESKDAAKLELLREQERDLLDTRSQPIRQYLMDNVVPHLTEGLIDLCKDIPDDPVDYLANFLLKKADEIDEKVIQEREAAALAKMQAKKLKF